LSGLTTDKTFIEDQFPVSLVSKESYKERKAGASQTLTGLGKWWGRKPLVLVRATIIGLLMPASSDPQKDREIFLKILTMDDDGLWERRSKSIPASVVEENIEEEDALAAIEIINGKVRWIPGTKKSAKDRLTKIAFEHLNYDDKLKYCDRPEQIAGPAEASWKEINAYLGTTANSIDELVDQLGKRQFGHTPRVGDAFCGGGSVPFEAARIGCEAYGSDLNPVAALLSWASIHLVGGGEKVQQQVKAAQEMAFKKADQQIIEWGIEHNSKGWRADAYLYCVEAICPATGYLLPLAPSWVISEKYRACAVLKAEPTHKRYRIEIVTGADSETFAAAKQGTVQQGRMICPESRESFPINEIRGDQRGSKDQGSESRYGLRLWENEDLVPRAEDTFQERLYCVRWVETYTEEDANGKEVSKIRRHFSTVEEEDLAREAQVLALLQERFVAWQEQGFIPSRKIEPGYNTTQPIRERGWTHWHHLFNPRQLLMHGTVFDSFSSTFSDSEEIVIASLSIGAAIDRQSRLCGIDTHISKGPGSTRNVFFNQALNTQLTYGVRPLSRVKEYYVFDIPKSTKCNNSVVQTKDARTIDQSNDLWITDPPYADAINYHELTEFFLAWYEKQLPKAFPEWYTDTKKALAVRGSGDDFKLAMVEVYRNLANHMPDNGLQMVMFTHQDSSVWADLAMILSCAGLRVTAAWTISTETDAVGIKKGNYVQGTVLLVLRKRPEDDEAFLDEIDPDVEDEVKAQLDHMMAIDDRDHPNFGDTDYQLAAYAAALKVITQYSEIDGHEVCHELFRSKEGGKRNEFEKVIDRAVEIASDHLVPKGIDNNIWRNFTAIERLYLKGVELEKHMEARSGAYQELAKGFGVRDYSDLYAKTKANQVRFKTPSEFKRTALGVGSFGKTLLRNILYAIHEAVSTEDVRSGLAWLKIEVADYWNQKKTIVAVLRYLGAMVHHDHAPHWEEDAETASVLAGVVENDHG